jgi:protein-disulfide isomerase
MIVGERVLSGGILEYGSADAPRALLAVVNYASPYSRAFLAEHLPRLRGDFIKNGTLRVRLLPLDLRKYPKSDAFASAVLCAAWQRKGMAMSDALASGTIIPEGKALAAMGIDGKTYQTCLKSADLARVRSEQRAETQRLEVLLAPTFFLDGERFQGLPEYPDLRGRIRTAMEEAQ